MRRMKATTRVVLTATLAVSCSSPVAGEPFADTVLFNGEVFTVDARQPWAEAVAVTDGRIVAVGDNETILAYADEATTRVDLDGMLLLPGFQDAHIHPLEGASAEEFFTCDLSEFRGSHAETWIEPIAECAEHDTPLDWVLGGSHYISALLELDRHPKDILDDAIPDRPVALMEQTSHSIWVNSAALEAAGITDATPDPVGGQIIRDPETGEATGLLMDSAGDELLHIALEATPELQEARYRSLLRAQNMLAENGITSITNARVYWDRGNLEPWLRAERNDALTARTVLALWAYPHMADREQIDSLKSMYRNSDDSLLRITQVKLYSDGVVSNNSGALLEPYARLIHPDANPMGQNYFTEERMGRYAAELETAGFDLHIHALGDRAVRESLNAIEYARSKNPELAGRRRHQLTHLALVHPTDIPRFASLDVSANVQFNFDLYEGDIGWWRSLLGRREALYTPILELDEAGSNLVLSSDWDVATASPLKSIGNVAVAFDGVRPTGELIELAIRAYTLNAAITMQHEDVTGSISPGKYADLVVVDQDIFDIDPEDIESANVVLTLLEGDVLFDPLGLLP